jgi:septal ring factor EnvC (AmiA/AmiB activator)
MPLISAPATKDTIKRVRLFVSEDRGKTWKHENDFKVSDEKATFTARRDGLYYFAIQMVMKDGKRMPDNRRALSPTMKVYVNSQQKTLRVQKSLVDLEKEVNELRKTVEQLQERLKKLEVDRD